MVPADQQAYAVKPEEFKRAMRATVASVNIITSQYEGKHYGLTATAFCSVSADPPTVLICVNANASACERIRLSGHFCVNVLTPGMEDLAATFAGKVAPENRFSTGNWRQFDSGNPIVEGCVAAFDCAVKAVFPEGSHWIVLGTVQRCEYQPMPALVYADGKYGRFEPAYVAV